MNCGANDDGYDETNSRIYGANGDLIPHITPCIICIWRESEKSPNKVYKPMKIQIYFTNKNMHTSIS